MAQGVGFSIDASFLKTLEQADKKMQSIIDKSNELGRATYNAFSQITKSGVVSYVKKLEQELATLDSISKSIGANSGMQKLKKDIDSLISTNNALAESLRNTSQYKNEVFSSTALNAGNAMINIFKELKTSNDAYLRSLQDRFNAEQGYQQRQQAIKAAREQETQQELQRYQQIIQKIKELEQVQKQAYNDKKTINVFKEPGFYSAAVAAEAEAIKQLEYYRAEARKIEQKHESEIAVLKEQNIIKEFKTKHQLHEEYLAQAKKREQELIQEFSKEREEEKDVR